MCIRDSTTSLHSQEGYYIDDYFKWPWVRVKKRIHRTCLELLPIDGCVIWNINKGKSLCYKHNILQINPESVLQKRNIEAIKTSKEQQNVKEANWLQPLGKHSWTLDHNRITEKMLDNFTSLLYHKNQIPCGSLCTSITPRTVPMKHKFLVGIHSLASIFWPVQYNMDHLCSGVKLDLYKADNPTSE